MALKEEQVLNFIIFQVSSYLRSCDNTDIQPNKIRFIERLKTLEKLEEETRAYCETLANNAPLSIKAHKVILGELSKERAEQSKIDAVATMCFDSDDYKEGRTAFMEKRAPVWKGA